MPNAVRRSESRNRIAELCSAAELSDASCRTRFDGSRGLRGNVGCLGIDIQTK
jgi:hypothetical protein